MTERNVKLGFKMNLYNKNYPTTVINSNFYYFQLSTVILKLWGIIYTQLMTYDG